MANSLVHEVTVLDRWTVETVGQLQAAINEISPHDNLSKTYVVEVIREHLSDGSFAHEINIREAERV